MDRTDELRAAFEAVRADVLELITGLADADWETRVQSEEEGWTVRNVVSHMLDTEVSQTALVQRVLEGLETIPDDFDIDRWNRGRIRRLADITPGDLVAGLEASRVGLFELLARLTPDDLQLEGRHPAFEEPVSLDRFLQTMARHERHHLEEIRSGLAAG